MNIFEIMSSHKRAGRKKERERLIMKSEYLISLNSSLRSREREREELKSHPQKLKNR